MRIEEGIELARFTTLGTGGPARAFALLSESIMRICTGVPCGIWPP